VLLLLVMTVRLHASILSMPHLDTSQHHTVVGGPAYPTLCERGSWLRKMTA
jgi:hypothetical protein